MVRQLRLISGCILFTYVLTHLVNHSLGIIAISAMATMLSVVYPVWSYPPITFVLYGALVVHDTAQPSICRGSSEDRVCYGGRAGINIREFADPAPAQAGQGSNHGAVPMTEAAGVPAAWPPHCPSAVGAATRTRNAHRK
jgi:hypothetical protein